MCAISDTHTLQLGGLNSVLSVERTPAFTVISKVPTIILGMDVSHGSPGQSDHPSIAAVIYFSLLFSYIVCFCISLLIWQILQYCYSVVSIIMVYLGGEFERVASNLQIQSICSHTAFKGWDDWVPPQEKRNRRRWNYQVHILTLSVAIFLSCVSSGF